MLSSATRLTPNFTAGELGADNPAIPATAERNIYVVARWLEAARAALGTPLIVKSGYRTPTHNLEVGGSRTSDHVDGLAADFVARGLTPWQVYARLRDATRTLPPWDQLIFYTDGHVHVGLGAAMRGQWRVNIAGEYPFLTTETARKLLPYVAILVLIFLAVRYA